MNHIPDLLRTRSVHGHQKVAFVELFFDLVFVFAVTQLSHGLIEHFSAIGLLQSLLLVAAVWWVWIYTSWVTNWLDPEKLPVRLMLLVMMGGGLLMSAAIPAAFEGRGPAFAVAYVCLQVGRTLFMLWALRRHPARRRNFERVLVWLTLSGVLWLAGSQLEGTERLACWAVALGLEIISPSLYFWVPGLGRSSTADWDVEGSHLAERCALFIIIALGESILVTGATLAGIEWDSATLAAFVVSFVGSLAMWWLYFDSSAEAGVERIAASDDPGAIARVAYTYIHLFLVAGIVMAAVADEFVLAHPAGHLEAKVTISVLAGAALYLLGNLLFRRAITGRWRVAYAFALAGLAALGGWAATSHALTPLLLSAAANAVLVLLAAWEWHSQRWCAPAETAHVRTHADTQSGGL